MADNPKGPPLVERIQPWDRQPNETERQFQQFQHFRDQGDYRSLRLTSETMGTGLRHTTQLSSRFKWRRRTEAYDTHLDRVRVDAHEKVVRKMAQQHALASNLMLAKAVEKLKSARLDEITLRDAILMIKTAIPSERLARLSEAEDLPMGLPPPRDDDDDDAYEAEEEEA